MNSSLCDRDEVKIYQTLNAKKDKKKILNQEEKKFLRQLCQTEGNRSLCVKVVNVKPQTETECGAICVALCKKFSK